MTKQFIITIRYYCSRYKSHDIYTTEPITVKTAFRWLWENIKEGDFPYCIKIQRAQPFESSKRLYDITGGRNMEEWIYCGHSDLSLPTWYDEYVRADDNTIVKQVWNDGYEEIYCTEED